jgi:uncharacterized protein (TIGR02444 family)
MSSDAGIAGFWDFSVRTYRTEGVPDACLSLQNDYGADVNMLLYCCWVGAVHGQFNDTLFGQSSGFSDQWCDSVVARLRAARTWMKHDGCFVEFMPSDDCMKLREKIKGVEFAAEKLQQEVLESFVERERSESRSAAEILLAAATNLARYLEHVAIASNHDTRNKLAIIVCAAFPEFASHTVQRALNQ